MTVPILEYLQAKAAIEKSKEDVGALTRVDVEMLASLRGETLEATKQVSDESWLMDG